MAFLPYLSLKNNAVLLGIFKKDNRDDRDGCFIDAKGKPDGVGPEKGGEQKDNRRIHNQAAQHVDGNGLGGALGRIQIGGDHHIDGHDDKAPGIQRQRLQCVFDRARVSAKQRADGPAEQQDEPGNHDASNHVDAQAYAEVELFVLCF